MNIQENILLKDLTTFRFGGAARYFGIVKSEEDLREAFAFVKSRKLPLFVLGGGSNLLISDQGFSGLIIKNEIKGIKFSDLPAPVGTGGDTIRVEIGAGEVLDEIITLANIRNLSGLENLSGIPGTVGGAAVQNAGAYGAEIKDCLVSVCGLNSTNGKEFNFKREDCQYGYRDSIFKKSKKYIVTAVTLELSKKPAFNLDYAGLKNKLINETKITIPKIREAVLKIRSEKLPDWRLVGTAGSYFKNPIITAKKYSDLKLKFPDLPAYSEPHNKVKVSLAWILDKACGLKGYSLGPVALYEKQPLVLVNLGGATAHDVIALVQKVKSLVKEKTGLDIEEEVERV